MTTKGTVARKGTVAELKERLERAIELSPFDTKAAFHRAFATLAEERGLAGRSNPVFYRHLAGMGRPPSTEWLRVFADIARVRWEWLAANDGPPSEAAAVAAAAADRKWDAIMDGAPCSFGVGPPITQALTALMDSFTEHPKGVDYLDLMAQFARILEQMALEPLKAFTPDDGVLCDRFTEYLNLMYSAFLVAIPAAGKGHSLAEFVEANRHRLEPDYPEWITREDVFRTWGPSWMEEE